MLRGSSFSCEGSAEREAEDTRKAKDENQLEANSGLLCLWYIYGNQIESLLRLEVSGKSGVGWQVLEPRHLFSLLWRRWLLELMHSDLCDCETQVTSSYRPSVRLPCKPREPQFLC